LRYRLKLAGIAAALLVVLSVGLGAKERFIVLASTTSTENSGLFRHILPVFQKQTGIQVRVVAVGTGQALKLARNGDADVLFVHHRPSEEKFVGQGFGVKRLDVMYNDFVIVGPKTDPAGIKGLRDATRALARISLKRSLFISRGDKSGTHKKERSLWQAAGSMPAKTAPKWYLETGSGMGAVLNMAAARNAYTLSDRGTWLSFANKRALVILVEGDSRLFNPYGVILVNPKKYPHVKAADGQQFIDWITGKAGQTLIAGYKRGGRQLFFPNATPASN
jgi:tungstate transport system substrate-binding protein